jgi:hypothetical protein
MGTAPVLAGELTPLTRLTARTLGGMLSLDDPRWLGLGHRNWSPGQQPGDDPDVPFVPEELRRLMSDPADFARFTDLWPYLCSEDTAWPAAYAAVPYLVELAGRLRPAERGDYLYVVGFIVICSGPYGQVSAGLPEDIAAAYRQALPKALSLITEQLATAQSLLDTRYYLAATAALKGFPEFGEFLNNLEASLECQECGEVIGGLPNGLI